MPFREKRDPSERLGTNPAAGLSRTGDGVYAWRAMASPISLHLPGLFGPVAEAVARAAAADIEASEQAMSRFRDDAELVRLNARLGEWVRVVNREGLQWRPIGCAQGVEKSEEAICGWK